jgi:hypothetical protein
MHASSPETPQAIIAIHREKVKSQGYQPLA